MSLGWLTESALQPDRGKLLSVRNDGSLDGLRDALRKGEEESKLRRQAANLSQHGVVRSRATKKREHYTDKVMRESNAAVEERNERDEIFANESLQGEALLAAAGYEAVLQRLQAKSKLYAESLARTKNGTAPTPGECDAQAADAAPDSSSSNHLRRSTANNSSRSKLRRRGGECLVDFERKAAEDALAQSERRALRGAAAVSDADCEGGPKIDSEIETSSNFKVDLSTASSKGKRRKLDCIFGSDGWYKDDKETPPEGNDPVPQ